MFRGRYICIFLYTNTLHIKQFTEPVARAAEPHIKSAKPFSLVVDFQHHWMKTVQQEPCDHQQLQCCLSFKPSEVTVKYMFLDTVTHCTAGMNGYDTTQQIVYCTAWITAVCYSDRLQSRTEIQYFRPLHLLHVIFRITNSAHHYTIMSTRLCEERNGGYRTRHTASYTNHLGVLTAQFINTAISLCETVKTSVHRQIHSVNTESRATLRWKS